MTNGITYCGVEGFITLFGKEEGIQNVGWFFLTNAGMAIPIRPISGKLFVLRGPMWILVPGAFFAIEGLVWISYTHSLFDLIWAGLVFGIGFISIQPSKIKKPHFLFKIEIRLRFNLIKWP